MLDSVEQWKAQRRALACAVKYAVDWTLESDGVSRAATAAAAPGSK